MKKPDFILLTILVIILLLFNIVLIKQNKDLSKSRQNVKFNYKGVFTNINENYIRHNYQIINDIHLKTIDNENSMLSEKISTPTLVLEVSEFNCSSCIDSTISILRQYEELLKTKCLLLVETHGMRNKILFERVSNLKLPVYYIERSVIDDKNVSNENKTTPYFYVLDKELSVKYYFRPEKTCVNVTKLYLSEVIKKLDIKKNEESSFVNSQ